MIEQMWAQELLSDFEPRNLSRDLAFSFYFKHEDSRRPRNDLRLVIRFVLEDTKISKEISRAAEAVNLDMNDENYARFKEAENRRRDLANWLREEMDRRQSEAESTESQEFA